jgi:hypothetical protein
VPAASPSTRRSRGSRSPTPDGLAVALSLTIAVVGLMHLITDER